MAEPVLNDLTVVVLAAGGGTRMKSKTPKMLHEIGGRSLVGHVLAAVRETSPRAVVTVVGHQRELVGPHVTDLMPESLLAVQEEQKGTG
ncbi:NTP transferase domain-containing protein, partial [Nocardioides sp.]